MRFFINLLRFEARDPKTDVGQGNLVVSVVDTEVTLTPEKKKTYKVRERQMQRHGQRKRQRGKVPASEGWSERERGGGTDNNTSDRVR
jgi:hypothetical protein